MSLLALRRVYLQVHVHESLWPFQTVKVDWKWYCLTCLRFSLNVAPLIIKTIISMVLTQEEAVGICIHRWHLHQWGCHARNPHQRTSGSVWAGMQRTRMVGGWCLGARTSGCDRTRWIEVRKCGSWCTWCCHTMVQYSLCVGSLLDTSQYVSAGAVRQLYLCRGIWH